MVYLPHPALVAVLLASTLLACSPAPTPRIDNSVDIGSAAEIEPSAGIDPNVSIEPSLPDASTLTIDAATLPAPDDLLADQDVAETDLLPGLARERAPLDERFFRPVLALDQQADQPLPEVLPEGANVSYVLLDLDRGTILAEQEADRDHIPASSAKLATAVAALELLGPEHRFRTELRATGPIEEGVLKGDLILRGGGDPRLDLSDLVTLIDELARLPLRHIEGALLIDDTMLPRLTEIEPAQPHDAAYNPGLSALSLAFNRVNLRWQDRRGFSAETIPALQEARFEQAKPDRLPPSGVQLKRFDGQTAVWQLADRGSRRTNRSLPVKDAGLHAGRVFADLAALYGIKLPAPSRLTPEQALTSRSSRLLAVHKSPPLRDMVRDMLWYSNNLVAELIGLAAAKSIDPDVADLKSSAGLLLAELEQQLPQTSWNTARLDNHSGLSSQARLTPMQLATILRHGWTDGILSNLLPGSGWSGTLTRRFNGEDQALRIWAKTGSINYVVALGGYLLSSTHGPTAFVVMISDDAARAAYDAQPHRTVAVEKKARTWQRDAEKAMNTIIGRWLDPANAPPTADLYALSNAENKHTN